MSILHRIWLNDQILGFCAANLVGSAPPSQTASVLEQNQLANVTRVIANKWRVDSLPTLSDATLALLSQISPEYDIVPPDMPEQMQPLADVRRQSASETKLREQRSGRVSSLLINHAVYVLKQPHLDAYRFFKWLKRNGNPNQAGMSRLLNALLTTDEDAASGPRSNHLLYDIRDRSNQTRDRVQAIDDLYEHLLPIAGDHPNNAWLLRLFLALRNSMYCWPLMIGGSSASESHGISLPIGLFLSRDERPKVDFKVVLPRGAKGKAPPYVPPGGETLAHMYDSSLQWDQDWASAFWLGVETAKDLWRSQNGRLKFVDEQAVKEKLTSSLVVDIGEACTIVDSVFGETDGSYTLKGRSAEAYWLQAVLGLLLPAGEIPLGVVTGRIERAGGAYELRHVEGIEKKLEYANNAGFPRVVLPGLEAEYAISGDASVTDDGTNDDALKSVAAIQETNSKVNNVVDLVRLVEEAEDSIQTAAKQEVRRFLQRLATLGSSKRIEINFCPNARSAADAMQPSGWRRATFLRLPEAQREFSFCLRRLFLQEKKRLQQPLSREEASFYSNNPWRRRDDQKMNELDRWLISETNPIKFVNRFDLDRKGGVSGLGKWLGWKDHQVRTGAQDEYGLRGPGLGILCLRTAEGDNDMRLWSTIADLVAANPEWLSRFQWADAELASQLLAILLGNRSARAEISLTSAPDILVVLDEGNFTQRRVNSIFPDDFRGNWLDLLNPTKGDPTAQWPLAKALRDLGAGGLGHMRIIIIYGAPSVESRELPNTISEVDEDLLRRLAVYRFGFSKQAAYAIINHKKDDGRISWAAVDEAIRNFRAKGLVGYARGQYFIVENFLETLRQSSYWSSPEAHLSAAIALAPIVDPNRFGISSNRDRSLEPETVIEAFWHLQRARALAPPRLGRDQVNAAFNNLVFLRPFSDWDTVKSLQTGNSRDDAVELGRELLNIEYQISKKLPHSSRVALLLNAIGEFGASASEAVRADLATEAASRCETALSGMSATSVSDKRRQRRKLFSDYLYCMRKLNVPNDDPRVSGAKAYLQQTVEEVAAADFFERIGEDFDGLDEYPVSSDWLRSEWEDSDLSPRDRARIAYVAARLSIGRRKNGKEVRTPWDGPWLDYFALTSPALFDAAQLNSPLMTWNALYGSDRNRTELFAKRVLDSASFRPRKSQELSLFGNKWRQATDNLWGFISAEDDQKRLRPAQLAIALRILRAIALSETLPAFDFFRRRELSWFVELPNLVRPNYTDEWNALARQAVTGEAGWVLLLSGMEDPLNEYSLEIARSWLAAYMRTGASSLFVNDPENFRFKFPKTMELAKAYQSSRRAAIWNGYQLLGRRNESGWAIYHNFRLRLEQIVDELGGETLDWFVALAGHRPRPELVSGVGLMLERHATTQGIEAMREAGWLRPYVETLIRTMPRWLEVASRRWRGTFKLFDDALSVKCVAPLNLPTQRITNPDSSQSLR